MPRRTKKKKKKTRHNLQRWIGTECAGGSTCSECGFSTRADLGRWGSRLRSRSPGPIAALPILQTKCGCNRWGGAKSEEKEGCDSEQKTMRFKSATAWAVNFLGSALADQKCDTALLSHIRSLSLESLSCSLCLSLCALPLVRRGAYLIWLEEKQYLLGMAAAAKKERREKMLQVSWASFFSLSLFLCCSLLSLSMYASFCSPRPVRSCCCADASGRYHRGLSRG
jgi:hypothetical protein